MLKMSNDNIFYISEEENLRIIEFYNETDEDGERNLKDFKKWYETQIHLPQNIDKLFLEMMLKLNKFNIEKARSKIDMYFSMRHLVPEFYVDRSPNCDNMKNFMDTLMILPLPHLTENLERVYLIKFLDTDPSKFCLEQNARFLLALFDVRLKYDTAVGEIYIYDLTGLRLGHILKVNPMLVRKIYTVMEKAYSDRIKGIHFLNMPFIGHALISMAKLILCEKLSNRVQSHKNLESLNKLIPQKLLPSEYNGTQNSIDVLYENWTTFFESKSSWLEEIGELKTNEELRLKDDDNSSIISNLLNMFKT